MVTMPTASAIGDCTSQPLGTANKRWNGFHDCGWIRLASDDRDQVYSINYNSMFCRCWRCQPLFVDLGKWTEVMSRGKRYTLYYTAPEVSKIQETKPTWMNLWVHRLMKRNLKHQVLIQGPTTFLRGPPLTGRWTPCISWKLLRIMKSCRCQLYRG